MSLRHRDTLTLDLFAVPQPVAPAPGSHDFRREVSAMVGEALKEADVDRYEIAARMSRLSGTEVSKYMLDAWSSEARDAYNLPFYQAPVLEAACNTHLFSNWLAGKRGGRLLLGKETLNAELGKLERLRDEAAKRIKDLKRLMGDME